jgi:4-hydroxyphenylpyruvate dioxygenase
MLLRISDLDMRARIVHDAGFRAWGVRGVDIEGHLHRGGRLADFAALGQRFGLKISDVGALNEWQWTGHPPLVNRQPAPSGHSEQTLWHLVEIFLERSAAIGGRIIVASGAIAETGEIEDAVKSYRQICDVAARHQLRVAYEVRGDAVQFRTYEQGWELVRLADRPNAGLLLDTYHFHIGGTRFEALLNVPIERILLVRLTDAAPAAPPAQTSPGRRLPGRAMPGDGVAPLQDIVRWLSEAGYSGHYVVEAVGPQFDAEPTQDIARLAFAKAAAVLHI